MRGVPVWRGRSHDCRAVRLAQVVIAGLLVAAGCGGGDDDSDEATDAVELGEAVAEAGTGTDTSQPSNVGTARSVTTTSSGPPAETRELPDLPPPEIPSEASPPTTAPGTEPDEWPIGFPVDEPGNTIPLIGEIVVDVEPEGYSEFPVHLEEGQVIAAISAGDDGIMTHIEIFRPDGTSEGSWEGGEPGVVNGWEWVSEGERIPMTGTWVFRVVHLGGSDGPFLLRFFGDA